MKLSTSRLQRVAMHLICLSRGGNWRWHIAGICREFHL
jgi:hypothetical protein